MSDFDLRKKFPDLSPIQAAPGLSTINGIGMTLVGRRDFDPETQSYVKTHCFSLLFIPLIAIGAYRVIDSPNGGWYFLGKVPLSSGKKVWNVALVAVIFAAIGLSWYHHHTNTPDYLAGERIEHADKLASEGKAKQAAEIYRDELGKQTKHATQAKLKLMGLIDKPPASSEEAAGVYRIVLDLHRQNNVLFNDLFQRGMDLADSRVDADPRGALSIIDTVAPLAPNSRDVVAVKRKILEKLVLTNPDDLDLISKLAVVCDLQGETERCAQLLQPHANRLGGRDGAAILGKIEAGKGNLESARKLLQPYVRARMPKLQAAEKNYANESKRVQEQAANEWKQGNVPDFDYAQYDRSNQEQQRLLIGQFLQKRMNQDSNLQAAEQALAEQTNVISAALDLGMVLLQVAQQNADPEIRKKELQEAEKTFLDIRGVAGDSDSYRINLGQVYYWLGKHSDGKKEFDDLLKSRNRELQILLAVSKILREVGDITQARSLAEEAYQKGKEGRERHAAAGFRAVMFKDIDDEILWLGRSDAAEPDIRASLHLAKGKKAREDGKDAEAAGHFSDAINDYNQMSQNTATLNNCAIVHFSLYHLTQEKEHLVQGMDKMERAVAQQPSDSILLQNASSFLLDEAIRDVVGDRIDFKALKRQRSGLDIFSFLYDSDSAKKTIVEQFRKHPGFSKGRQFCDKLMILTPKGDDSYSILAGLYLTLRDVDGLRSVWQRLEKAELDQAEELQERREYLGGKNDPKKVDEAKKSVARNEAVMADARKKGGATLAVAVSDLVRARMHATMLGEKDDADELVKLAEEAYAAAPSSGSRNLLTSALNHRAHKTLIKEDPGYAKLASALGRSLGPVLVTFVLSQDGPYHSLALANADVKRMIELRLENAKKVPDDRHITDWAAIHSLHAREGKEFEEMIAKSSTIQLEQSIRQKISPLDGSNALEGYWTLRLSGKPKEADEWFKQFKDRGLPLPDLIK